MLAIQGLILYICEFNMAITMLAVVQASNGARPSASTVLTTDIDD